MMTSSSKDSGYVDNWQAGKTVTQCNLHMLTTEDCSDVIFHVGSEKQVVRAHRYVLVSRSCVFHAMFCGPLAEKGEVTIPDIEAHIFKEFLRYLYTDDVNITSESITGLLYTSRKYAVDTLFNQCAAFMEKSLSEDNVCQILEQCHGYGELDLEQKALKILTEAGEKVIKSPGFLDLCVGCLEKFLKSELLNLKEGDIFEAVVSWAKEKCRKENTNVSPENVRKCLGDMIFEIRFTAFPQEYMVNVVGPSGLLTHEERLRILERTINASVDITPFKISLRKSAVNRVDRFGSIQSSWGVGGRPEAISFSVNRDIQLLGCQLYGPASQEESTYKLNIVLYDGLGEVIAEPVPATEKNLRGGKDVRLNDIWFPDPLSLITGRTYTVCIAVTGLRTYYGEKGQTSVHSNNGTIFTFMDSTKSTPKLTSKTIGQIPGLIWSE